MINCSIANNEIETFEQVAKNVATNIIEKVRLCFLEYQKKGITLTLDEVLEKVDVDFDLFVWSEACLNFPERVLGGLYDTEKYI